jgi:hypothetical protein
MSFFSNIDSWFSKVFKKATSWNVIALGALNVATPLLETILEFSNPAAEAAVAPILSTIQSDLGALSATLTAGSTKNVSSLVDSIKTNLPVLLAAAKISDPASVTKATGIVSIISNELDTIVSAVPAV